MEEIFIDDELLGKCRKDFKNFLFVVFKYIGLPSPTPIQYAIADELQYRTNDTVIEGFRGVAKSTITGIYVAWRLWLDPERVQILVVSANQAEATGFMKFTRSLLEVVPFLNHLRPDISRNQRDSALQFDVAPAIARKQPSCKALGIFGQLTGNRATEVIADDIETSVNCKSQIERDKIVQQVKEFRQIVEPLGGDILYLGTPHTEISIYNKLYEKGHTVRIFPIKYPDDKQAEKYGDKLAPYIKEKIEQDPTLVNMPTDPLRFNEDALMRFEAEGRSTFMMQQMLDTTLSDLERYPLRCSDLIVIDCDKEIAPEKVAYGSSPNLMLKDIPCNGIGTDNFFTPIPLSDIKWLNYAYKSMTIDPSGRGKDELAFTIGGVLNAQLFLLKQGGMQGGYCEENLYRLANMAKGYKVNRITIESNFGDGMFTTLFTPIMKKVGYQCEIVEIRHNTQKEKRIIDTLEPVMNQHRLVVCKSVIKEDRESISVYPTEIQQQYSLFYQLTRITKDRGCLSHDDRLDCLAMWVKDCLDFLQIDVDTEIRERKEREFDEELERIFGFSDKEDVGWFDLH